MVELRDCAEKIKTVGFFYCPSTRGITEGYQWSRAKVQYPVLPA